MTIEDNTSNIGPISFQLHISDESLTQIDHIHNECMYHAIPVEMNMAKGFTVLHMNVRSLKNKVDAFQSFLLSSGIAWSVICISETWLKPDILKYYNLDGYNLFASCREEREGGGTAIYVHNSLPVKRRDDLVALSNGDVFVEVQIKNNNITKSLVVGGLYRPPSFPHPSFMSYLEDTLAKIDVENKLVLLAGDFNYDLFKVTQDKHVLSFQNLLYSYGYISLISRATRIDREHSSLLDNIFINDHNFVKSSGVIVNDLSDHFPVFASFSFSSNSYHKPDTRKIFDNSKLRELNEFIANNLINFQTITDPNVACDYLIDTFTKGINNYSKTYTPSRRKKTLLNLGLRLAFYVPLIVKTNCTKGLSGALM